MRPTAYAICRKLRASRQQQTIQTIDDDWIDGRRACYLYSAEMLVLPGDETRQRCGGRSSEAK